MKRFSVLFVLAGVLVMSYSLAVAQVYEFSKPNVPVNDDSLGKHQHYCLSTDFKCLAARGDMVYAAFHDNRTGSWHIWFSRSTDAGVTWSRNIKIDDDSTATYHYEPAITIDQNGGLYVIWRDNRTGYCSIFLSKSTNGGLTFGPNKRVSNAISGESDLFPAICTWGVNKVVVGYFHAGPGYAQLLCTTSTDGGASFSFPAQMNDSTPSSGFTLGIDDQGRACAAWESFINSSYHIIFYSRATDPGDSLFLPQIPIADTGAWFPDQGGPALATGPDGKVYVVWMDGRNLSRRWFEVYFTKSSDYGATFGPDTVVDDDTMMAGRLWPSVVVDDSGGVYATWTDSRNGNKAIYFAKSTNDGASFGPNVLVDDSASNDTAPRYYSNLAVNRQTGKAFVIWADERNEPAPRTTLDIYSAWGMPTTGVESGGKLFGGSRRLLQVEQNRTNPFTKSTSISYEISEKSLVSFVVLNVAGQVVRNLLRNEEVMPGKHVIQWDGITEGGEKASSGVYFYQIVAFGKESGKTDNTIRKMILLR